MSEEWRRIAEFERPVSNLRLSASDDAEIELRFLDSPVVFRSISLHANEQFDIASSLSLPIHSPFAVYLRSANPECQCQIQAEYVEEVTGPILDMRQLYGLMGLGIPMAVSGNPFDYQMVPARPPPPQYIPDIERIREIERRGIIAEPEQEKPAPGITRLQAFKRELEEEKPKEKEVKKKK